MTLYEIAQRLGVHETAVRTVVERENDCIVTLRDDRKMLVSPTTARVYVPEVDDPPVLAPVAEEPDEGPSAELDDDDAVEEKPAKRPYTRRAKVN